MMDGNRDAVLTVSGLKTHFRLEEGVLKAVDDVSFSVRARGTLGIIGESGCGKSVTAQSVMRIVPDPGRIAAGSIVFRRAGGEETDMAALDPDGPEARSIRGKEITMIFQEPMTSFSPVHTIGNQITEAIHYHVTRDRKEAEGIAIRMLEQVGISNARQRMFEYPHQLSGGLRQRAMIAMALSCNPSLLIADEPTTALDVTVQAQILKLIRSLQEKYGMAVLYITHNLGVVAEICEDVAVMYLGKVVEQAPVRQLFHGALHPYTQLLLRSIPRVGKKARTRLDAIKGMVPIPINFPEQCGFFDRCPEAKGGRCDASSPPLIEVEPGHWVRCFTLRGSQGGKSNG
jgi:peptide/nickel transport system ATP-binding protein